MFFFQKNKWLEKNKDRFQYQSDNVIMQIFMKLTNTKKVQLAYKNQSFIERLNTKKLVFFCKNSKNVVYDNAIFDIITSSPKFLQTLISKAETISVQNLNFVAHSSSK